MESERQVAGKTSIEQRFFLSSLPGDAGQVLRAVRGHWGIENRLHWSLDVSFREDESRVRTSNAPENLALLRKIALNLLRQEKSDRSGIKTRRLRAGWDNDYLLKVLTGS